MIENFVYDVFLVASIMSVAALMVIFSYRVGSFFQRKYLELKLQDEDENR